MDPAQCLQALIVKTLHTNREAVDTDRPKAVEAFLLKGAGIRLHGDLDFIGSITGEIELITQTGK